MVIRIVFKFLVIYYKNVNLLVFHKNPRLQYNTALADMLAGSGASDRTALVDLLAVICVYDSTVVADLLTVSDASYRTVFADLWQSVMPLTGLYLLIFW